MNFTCVYQRLIETAEWCSRNTDRRDPPGCLRSPHLRPSHLSLLPDPPGYFDYRWKTPEENQRVVESVAERRAGLLKRENLQPEASVLYPHHGRLLLVFPEESDGCDLSRAESEGFIDEEDVPPWDTWVYYGEEKNEPAREAIERENAWRRRHNHPETSFSETARFLLCWIPSRFISVVTEGAAVNPTECFWWASEYRQRLVETPLLRELDRTGLIW